MSLYQTWDGIIGGERINPPEWASNNSEDCAGCGEPIDLDDHEFYELQGEKYCVDCRVACAICGDWMDEADASHGAVVCIKGEFNHQSCLEGDDE